MPHVCAGHRVSMLVIIRHYITIRLLYHIMLLYSHARNCHVLCRYDYIVMMLCVVMYYVTIISSTTHMQSWGKNFQLHLQKNT